MLILDTHSRGRLCHTGIEGSDCSTRLIWDEYGGGAAIYRLCRRLRRPDRRWQEGRASAPSPAAPRCSPPHCHRGQLQRKWGKPCRKHGGKIGVVGQNDPRRPRMLLQILLHCLFGFTDVDRQNDESLLA